MDCHKSINFKISFRGNMFALITTFKNMVAKFVGGCSVATCSYVIIYSMSVNCFTVIVYN